MQLFPCLTMLNLFKIQTQLDDYHGILQESSSLSFRSVIPIIVIANVIELLWVLH